MEYIFANDSRLSLLLRSRVAIGILTAIIPVVMLVYILSSVGLCRQPMMLIEKLTHLSGTSYAAGLCVEYIFTNDSSLSLLLRSRVAIGLLTAIIPVVMLVYILGVLFTSCFRSRIHLDSMNRRRTNLGSHVWSRRKVFWRHAGVSRGSYIIYAKNSKLEKLFGLHVMSKIKSRRKKVSSYMGRIPPQRISAVDTEHEVRPAYLALRRDSVKATAIREK